MIQDRDKENKNRGKPTRYLQHSEDLCGKLKNLNIRVSEGPENTDNFSKMKDLRINNFGDETINQIGDQFSNIKIVDEYNFPTSKKAEAFDKIVLNIVCDNNVHDKENYRKDSNINSDEEQILTNENKKSIPEIGSKEKCIEQKTNGKLASDTTSLIDNDVKKKDGDEVDGATEPHCNISEASKKTKEINVVLCSRGPVSQKICQPTYDPYRSCSRSLHSGGRVRVAEPFVPQIHPSVNGFQQLPNNIQLLNIISNGQERCAPPVQTSYLHATDNQTDINITDEDIDRIIADLAPENCERAIQELSQIPVIKQCCDILRGPSSPEDSATSSMGSPYASQPPTSVSGMSDSGVGSPTHGVEYPTDPHLQTLSFPSKTEYCNTWITENCNSYTPKRQGTQEWQATHGRPGTQEWQSTQERPGTQEWQSTQERPAVQKWSAIQEWPTAQKSPSVQEWPTAQKSPSVQEWPTAQKNPSVQEWQTTQKSPSVHEWSTTQKSPSVHEWSSTQKSPSVHEWSTTQKNPSVQEWPTTQKSPSVQEWPTTQKSPSVQEWSTTQKSPAVPEWQTKQEGPATPCKQTLYEEKVAQPSQTIGEKQMAQNSQTIHDKQVAHEKQPLEVKQVIQEKQTPLEKQRSEVTKYRTILPKPKISSAKARFQQILDKDRRLLAWAKTRAEDPKKFESQDAEGDTDLMIVCSNKFEGHLELLYAMVELMRNIPNSLTITNDQGHSALYLACKVLPDVPVVAGYIAETLLELKMDLTNMTYDGGHTLIQILEKEGDTHKKVLEELLALKDSSGKNVFQPSGNDVNGC